ncbi:hypothetical protein ACFQX6_52035 [Streptosporangium lutulentum]
MSLDGTRVYVANANVGSGSVSVVDTATNAVTATIAVGVNPRGATISPDGTRLYVTNTGSGSVSVIDTATNTVTATIAVNRPGGVGVTPDGTRAYVTNSNLDTVSVIDTATNTVTETMTGLGLWPFAVVFVEVGTATSADIDVNLGAQPRLGLLVPYLTYTLTARNTGPGAVTSATLTATLPPGKKATNLAAGCVTTPGTVTCTYGAIAERRQRRQNLPRPPAPAVTGQGQGHRRPHHQRSRRPQPGQRSRRRHLHCHLLPPGHLPLSTPRVRRAPPAGPSHGLRGLRWRGLSPRPFRSAPGPSGRGPPAPEPVDTIDNLVHYLDNRIVYFKDHRCL